MSKEIEGYEIIRFCDSDGMGPEDEYITLHLRCLNNMAVDRSVWNEYFNKLRADSSIHYDYSSQMLRYGPVTLSEGIDRLRRFSEEDSESIKDLVARVNFAYTNEINKRRIAEEK